MSEKAKRVALSLADAMKVGDLLRQHLAKPEGKDYWEYAVGWSDEEIAKRAGGTAKATNVARVRETLFGKLQSQRGGSHKGNAELEARVATFETQLSKLQGEYADVYLRLLDVTEHFNRLITRIKHHHLGDFKDLMMEIPK